MGGSQQGGAPVDVLASLRSNPVLASVSEDALRRIAEMVASETRAQVRSALRDVELFEGLSNEDLEEMQGIAEPVVVEAGGRLFEEGDADDRFFVIVRGEIERTSGAERAAGRTVLGAGDSFGQDALLGDRPRSFSARALTPSYLISLKREPFLGMLGGDSLAVRLLRNLSAAYEAGPRQDAGAREGRRDAPREAIAEYNRMVRGRLLPRTAPNVPGYDVSASTVAEDDGAGAAAWDWFALPDGRPALAVLKVDQPGLSAAHRLETVRALVRSLAEEAGGDPGALLTRVSRGLRAAWVEGISGSVSCGLLSFSDEGVVWAAAGEVGGTIVQADGSHRDLVPDAPSLGSDDGLAYETARVELAPGARLLVFSDGPSDAVIVGRRVLASGTGTARQVLGAVLDRIRGADGGLAEGVEVTAALVTRAPRFVEGGDPRNAHERAMAHDGDAGGDAAA